tara:strand:- start:38822 stop:39736 length:915 start_codon:yes stop_codon:yes gene_type:complete
MFEAAKTPEKLLNSQDAQVDSLIRLMGEQVRAARKNARLSRRELSEISGVSPRYLAQLEGGEGNVSIGILKRIALAMDLPIEALIGSDDPLSVEVARVLTLYRTADAATRTRVQEMLDPDRRRQNKAERICLIGLRGAGKSTLGALVAEDFGMPFVELNSEIEKEAGIPVSEIFSLYGDEGYRRLEADTVDKIVASHARMVLAVGGGVVSTADTFSRVLTRFHSVWLKAQPEEHMDRVRKQGDMRPMADNPQAMVQLRQILRSREAQYGQADYQLDTSGKSVQDSRISLKDLLLSNGVAEASDA